jgi:import receptor subunit TOM70
LFKPDPIFYSNRGACFANLGQNEKVIEDCNQALALDPMYVKALNRRGLALEKKEDYENALYGKSSSDSIEYDPSFFSHKNM